MYLFGEWENNNEKELIWLYKRKKLQKINYQSKYGTITVQKGWWYSSHEQWKLLVLPYLSVPITKRLFTNCEKARILHSVENNILPILKYLLTLQLNL
jgi:hypothetical protein